MARRAARLEKLTLPRTRGIICISDYVQNLVKNYGVPTAIVPNAIQKMFFDFPRTPPPDLEKPLIVNVGVISERKRQPELLAILTSLREEGLKFDTLFVGVLSLPNCLTPLNSTADWSRRTGNMAASNISRGWMTRISAGCLTGPRAMIHFSAEESFGLTFAEAIARDCTCLPRTFAPSGIAKGMDRVQILDLNDWEGLKRAVRQWLVSGGDRLPRPVSSPAEFVQRYHPRFVAQRHLEIYREVLQQKS